MKTIHIPRWLTYNIILTSSFLFVFLFSCTTSPLYEHYPFWFHGDSGIFQEMGVCLLQGGTPYVDLFDHKGPILWFVQALGLWISPHWGLMMLQSLSLFCTLIIWYKTARMVVDKTGVSIVIALSGLLFLLAFYQRGNLCEEWCLPFISLPIYLYFRGCKKQQPCTQQKSFVIGLCVGVIAMIRLNNTAPIIGFVLWDYIVCVKHKEYKRLWTNIAAICGGVLVVFVGCVLFYLIKASWNGVYEMIYGTFIFNFEYYNANIEYDFLLKLRNALPVIGFMVVSILMTFIDGSHKQTIFPISTSYVISFFAIGSHDFVHYMIIFIPLFIVTICFLYKCSKKWLTISMVIIAFPTCYLAYEAADHLLFRLRGKTANTEINDGFHRFASALPNEERKSIYNNGLNHMGAGLFADENIYQCNRIIYGGHVNISPRLQEYQNTHGIKELQPIWILTQGPKPVANDEYMQSHYTLADSIPGGEFDPIWCWKKL